MKIIHLISLFLVIIGALNWGSVGLFQYDFVKEMTVGFPMIAQSIYILVGLAGIVLIFTYGKYCSFDLKE